MTDNEIIKELEDCANVQTTKHTCDCCELFNMAKGGMVCVEYALDLINRQKAEKEALINGQETLQKYMAEQKAEIRKYKNCYEQVKWERDLFEEQCKTAKAEAIKEFAERLKEKAREDYYGDLYLYTLDIDDLVKEMVGDAE